MGVQQFPEEYMCLDVITKPNKGKEIWEFRSKLMNVPVNYSDYDSYSYITYTTSVFRNEVTVINNDLNSRSR